MAVTVPKVELPPRRPGLVQELLPSILYPMRYQAMQEAQTQGLQDREESSRQEIIKAIQNNPALLDKLTSGPNPALAPTGAPAGGAPAPATGGATPQPPAPAPTPRGSELESIFPAKQPYGTSSRLYENILTGQGLPGGKQKLAPSFTGFGPQGEMQFSNQPVVPGGPMVKPPQVVPGLTEEGGRTLVPKVPGVVVASPTAQAAQKVATAAPTPYTDLRKSVLAAGGTPADAVTAYVKQQEQIRGSFPRPSAMPPGVFFDGATKSFRDAEGNALTTAEVQALEYAYQEGQPTTSFKTMQQRAIPALDLVHQTQDMMNSMSKMGLGPLAGRLRDFTQGRIGASDPDFNSLRTLTVLLTTQVSAAHIGLRPPIQVMSKFDQLTDITHQDANNINAALTTIEKYLNDLAKPRFRGGPGQPPIIQGGAPPAATAPAAAPVFQPLPGESYQDYLKRAAAAGIK